MFDIAILVFGCLFFLITLKMWEWDWLYWLGMKSHISEAFLRGSKIYTIRYLFFALAFMFSFRSTIAPWYFWLGILIIFWASAYIMGARRAFNTYRKGYQEMVLRVEEQGDDSGMFDDSFGAKEMEELSKKTNRELRDIGRSRRAMGLH